MRRRTWATETQSLFRAAVGQVIAQRHARKGFGVGDLRPVGRGDFVGRALEAQGEGLAADVEAHEILGEVVLK